MYKIILSFILSILTTSAVAAIKSALDGDEALTSSVMVPYVAAGAGTTETAIIPTEDPFLKLEAIHSKMKIRRLIEGSPKEELLISMENIDRLVMDYITKEKYQSQRLEAPTTSHAEINAKMEAELLENKKVLGGLVATRTNPRRVASMGRSHDLYEWILWEGSWQPINRMVSPIEDSAPGEVTIIADSGPTDDSFTNRYLKIIDQNTEFPPLAHVCLNALETMPLLRARIFRESYRYYLHINIIIKNIQIEELEKDLEVLDPDIASHWDLIDEHRTTLKEIVRLKQKLELYKKEQNKMSAEIEILKGELPEGATPESMVNLNEASTLESQHSDFRAKREALEGLLSPFLTARWHAVSFDAV